MANIRTSLEGQSSLSLKETAPSQHDAAPATSLETPTPPMPHEKTGTEAETTTPEYITGFKLYVVLFGLTLVGFVIMLDATIVATVSRPLQYVTSSH